MRRISLIKLIYGMVFLGLMCGCGNHEPSQTDYYYPSVLPIWIVEDDPTQTIFDRKDLKRDRKVGKIMVIPLYVNYSRAGGTDALAIAHPFVYEQGEDIEKHLSAVGQRENLARLIFWVPGYFPDGMGRTYRWMPIINGKKMVVLELQKCIGTEETEINSAMKSLLLDGDFTVGETIFLKPPPPPYTPAQMSEESYDMSRLVQSPANGGRYFNYGSTPNTHAIWALDSGTKVVNRLSDEEKKTVSAFADSLKETKAKQDRN